MSSSETELYLEFELLSEIIKELQVLIEYRRESSKSSSDPSSLLRSTNAYYCEINNAIYDNMIGENLFGGADEFFDAAENYALKNMTTMEDAFKPKEFELAKFGVKFIRNPFNFNVSSSGFMGATEISTDVDEKVEDSVTLADVKHLLPAFLIKELDLNTEDSMCSTSQKNTVNLPKIDPLLQNYYKVMTEYSKGFRSPVRHPFYPTFMGSSSQSQYQQQQQQQRFNQNFLYYARPPIPPPGFPAYHSTIDQLKKDRQKKIEELINRGKDRAAVSESNVSLDDSLGVDVLKDETLEEDDDDKNDETK